MKIETGKVYTCTVCNEQFLDEKTCATHEAKCVVERSNNEFKTRNNYRTAKRCFNCKHYISVSFTSNKPYSYCDLLNDTFCGANVYKNYICDKFEESERGF